MDYYVPQDNKDRLFWSTRSNNKQSAALYRAYHKEAEGPDFPFDIGYNDLVLPPTVLS